MSFELQFLGATGEVTGSLYAIRVNGHTVLLECGMFQGSHAEEQQNLEGFPVPVEDIDAVILSHAHIDHSGRIPLLCRSGFAGPIYTQHASVALCRIMLPDSGYLQEKDAEWENRRRKNHGKKPVEPLYTREDAECCLQHFQGVDYGVVTEVVPGLTFTLHDAGHILGAAIVELVYDDGSEQHTLVFSGDLGHRGSPVMNSPATLSRANVVIMESTYGDRLHREREDTIREISQVFESARQGRGNILIPSFTIGRTQDLLYLMKKHFDDWGLERWRIFLDSPMAIEATTVYAQYQDLYGPHLFKPGSTTPDLPNFHATLEPEESMAINEIRSGAIIIAGSGMCTGGRIRHHLKNNIWRPECHVMIVGFQGSGTPGRQLVDGAKTLTLWGEEYAVRARIHTIGGLSAHADQEDLLTWYGNFENHPPVYLVHGEKDAQEKLAIRLRSSFGGRVTIAQRQQKFKLPI
jgi:metallo-beta-lactamase family protein